MSSSTFLVASDLQTRVQRPGPAPCFAALALTRLHQSHRHERTSRACRCGTEAAGLRENVRSCGRSMILPKGLDAVPLLVVPVSLYLCRAVVRLRSLWILFPAVAGIRHANFWMSRNGRSWLLKLNGPIFGHPWRTLSCWKQNRKSCAAGKILLLEHGSLLSTCCLLGCKLWKNMSQRNRNINIPGVQISQQQ